ncbi:MAG: hypothetical protein SFY80_03210 [Verrucomicrobiota bacterium]|nr:hypothetical protein [Verrucomicrobiota bacterium]
MPLSLRSNFPGGNARFETQSVQGDVTEVHFSAEPTGGSEALWFNFTLAEPKPMENPPAGRKLKLVWRYFDGCCGASDAGAVRPVIKYTDQDWVHLRIGRSELQPDGQHWASWDLDYPAPAIHLALGFPYDKDDAAQLIQKTRQYWHEDVIGLTQTARPMHRIASQYGTQGGTQPGIYIVARAFPGEHPASWVLDGLLGEMPRMKKQNALVWAVPFADPDGAHKGNYGRGGAFERPEWTVLRRDIQRWQGRCRPSIVLELQAAKLDETEGVRAILSGEGGDAEKWANVIFDGLGPEYAAKAFKQQNKLLLSEPVARVAQAAGVPHLVLGIPWSTAGGKLLSRKSYREIGQRLASVISTRAQI